MHEFLINIVIFRPDIIILIEVLPNNSETKTTKASIQIKGFQLFPNIEDEENIRGLALYISNNLKVEDAKFSTISKDNTWCTLNLKDNDKLLLVCIYRSPRTNNDNTQSLCNLLQEVDEIIPTHP